MDGAGIAAALDLGAVAAQLGTAFVACPKSAADDAYRGALAGPAAHHTAVTAVISGRPARTLANRFTALGDRLAALQPSERLKHSKSRRRHIISSCYGLGQPRERNSYRTQASPMLRTRQKNQFCCCS